MNRTCVKGKKSRYSKKNPKHKLLFRTGFDLLQYTIVVRPFILRKYSIENPIVLDVLLYLFPFQYFSMPDFKLLPIKNMNVHLKHFKKDGYIDDCLLKGDRANKLYRLTPTAQQIVTEYYEYLSGEKTIKEGRYTNPFNYKEATKIDKERENVMLKLKRQTETRISKFGDSFY